MYPTRLPLRFVGAWQTPDPTATGGISVHDATSAGSAFSCGDSDNVGIMHAPGVLLDISRSNFIENKVTTEDTAEDYGGGALWLDGGCIDARVTESSISKCESGAHGGAIWGTGPFMSEQVVLCCGLLAHYVRSDFA